MEIKTFEKFLIKPRKNINEQNAKKMEINKMLKIKSKKAQTFTLIAIALLLLFFVSYEVYSMINERTSIKTRIKTMDSFLFSLEENLERQLYISGFRIIFLAEKEISETGNYIVSFSEFFDEAVTSGTIYGTPNEIMSGATISDIVADTQEKADIMNLIVNFSNVKVSVGQEDPWNVIVYFNATLNLTDKSNLASWYKKERIKTYVSIEDFEDPLYLIETNGKVSRKINQTIYEPFNLGNLNLHLQQKLYVSHTDAPSFIDRLEGKNAENENGVESFVYLPDLSAQGVPVYEKSVVDHIYFSSQNPSSSQVAGLPTWFRIDDNHKNKYGII